MKVIVLAICIILNAVNAQDVHSSKCSGELTKSTGSFGSPELRSQPGFYPDNSHCKWNITVPRGGNVTITFTKFETEACCDYVKVTNERGTLIGQYSGPRPKFDVTVQYDDARKIDIVFKSDSSISKSGFHAQYVIRGIVKPVPLLKVTPSAPPVQVVPVAVGGGDSLMEAFLKMTHALTRIMNAVIDSPKSRQEKDIVAFKSELYQALKNIETLKSVKSTALTKDENEQMNLALKHLNLKGKSAILKLEPKLSPVVCKLRKVVGPCRAAFRRFYYDNTRKACRHFTYGGCQGNGNNFDKKEDCDNLCDPNFKPLCPKGIPVFNCFVNPCQASSCPAYSTTSRCEANYCGGCNSVYYDQHKIAIPFDRCHCQPGETTVQCVVDPCQNACSAFPDAKCRSRRCGSCTAEFVALNGTIIQNC